MTPAAGTESIPVTRAPSWALLGTEPLRAMFEYTRSRSSRLVVPDLRGDGHPVIVFPGLASDDMAMRPLINHCKNLGYDSRSWGRGYNVGPRGEIEDWFAGLADDVEQVTETAGQRATLIGWSLGGIYAREIARLRPKRVRQVITIGTPFAGTAAQTNAAWLYRLLNGRDVPRDPVLEQRLRLAPPVPTTSIYSRSDGVVAWQACLQAPDHRRIENVEVISSHLGMGWNTQVLDIVTDRLAQKPARWKPYAGRPVQRIH